MEHSYYADARKNYLVLPCAADLAEENGYQYKMLAANRIDGILPCSLRTIDGKQYLYCDITGLQSIAALYTSRVMDASVLKGIFFDMVRASQAMSGFLLDDRRLLLTPEFVYCDMDAMRWHFVYYPEPKPENSMGAFLSALYGIVNSADREAAQALVLSEFASDPNFRLLPRICERVFGPEEETLVSGEEPGPAGAGFGPEPEEAGMRDAKQPVGNPPQEEEKDVLSRAVFWEGGESYVGKKRGSSRNERSKRLSGMLKIAALFLFLGGAAELVYLYADLVYHQALLVRSVVLTLPVLAVCIGLFGTYISLKGRQEKIWAEEEMLEAEAEFPVGPGPDREEAHSNKREEIRREALQPPEPRNKLYGTGEARHYRIDLNDLPQTVGCSEGFSDTVIPEEGIGKVHARFYRDGENRVRITDLNSTGGSWVNGRRLLPNESETLCPWDEVVLGGLEFSYR